MERALLEQYEADLAYLRAVLSPVRLEAAAALASVPSLIRGYGHVKEANARRAAAERDRLLARLAEGQTGQLAAAE